MPSSDEQTSLWEQSTLLELVGATAEPAQPSRPSGQAPLREPGEPGPGAERPPVHQPGPSPGASSAATDQTRDGSARSNGAAGSHGHASGDGGFCVENSNGSSRAMPPAPAAEQAASADAAAATPGALEPDEPPPAAAPAAVSAAARNTRERTQDPSSAERADGAASRSPSLPPLANLSDGPVLPPCPQRLLILDTETTALTPEQGQCIELGAVLFDVASRAVLMQVSFLLPCDHNPAQSINGIPAAVSRQQQPWRSGLSCFEAMVESADALLAHNVGFDRQWFGCGALPALDKPWICSMEDIRWPQERLLRANPSVRDLALAYEVPVWAAHRALTDCTYLVQVLQRCDQLESLLSTALEPRRLVRARLPYDQRQLAKDAGFRWNEPVPKAWSRRLSEREIAALPFAVDPVEADEPGPQRRELQDATWRRSA